MTIVAVPDLAGRCQWCERASVSAAWRQSAEVNRPAALHVNTLMKCTRSSDHLLNNIWLVILWSQQSEVESYALMAQRRPLCCKYHWLSIIDWCRFGMAAGFAPPKLKDFILTEKLGSGTYATVYKAFRKASDYRSLITSCVYRWSAWFDWQLVWLQTDSREAVAVKVVSKKSLNKTSMENLLTEIEILKTVRHPHIVQLKDFQVWIDHSQHAVLCVCVDDPHPCVCPSVGQWSHLSDSGMVFRRRFVLLYPQSPDPPGESRSPLPSADWYETNGTNGTNEWYTLRK